MIISKIGRSRFAVPSASRHAGMRFTADFFLIFGGRKPYACYLLQFVGNITDYPSVEQVDGPLCHSRVPL